MNTKDRLRRAAWHVRKLARLTDRGESCWTCRRHKLVGAQSWCRSSTSQVGTVETTADAICLAWCTP